MGAIFPSLATIIDGKEKKKTLISKLELKPQRCTMGLGRKRPFSKREHGRRHQLSGNA